MDVLLLSPSLRQNLEGALHRRRGRPQPRNAAAIDPIPDASHRMAQDLVLIQRGDLNEDQPIFHLVKQRMDDELGVGRHLPHLNHQRLGGRPAALLAAIDGERRASP